MVTSTSSMRTPMSKLGPDFSALKVASAVAVPEPMKAPLSLATAVPSLC